MKNNITLRIAVMVLLFFSIISFVYMCSGEKDKPINYDYQPETYGQYGQPCAKFKDLCDAPGSGYQILSDSTGGWTAVYLDVDSMDIGIINIYPSVDSLCFSLGDVSTGTVSNTICVPNDPFECEALETCPLLQTIRDSIQYLDDRLDTLVTSVYNVDVHFPNDSTIVYCNQANVCDTLALTPCETFAACDTFQQVINILEEHILNDLDTDALNEVQCMISGLNEVAVGDFLSWVLQNPDGSINSIHTVAYGECLDVVEVGGEGTKSSQYLLNIDFNCLRGKIICPNRDSTYFNTERGLVTEAIHIHYNPLTCVEIRDTVPHTNLSFDVLGGDSILIEFPDGTVDTFPIQHPVAPVSECGETQTFQDVATQGSVIEDANYRTKIYYLILDGEVCVIEDRDTFYRVNPDLLEAYVTNLYNTDLCCPNDSILTIQNENGLDTAKVWRTYECGTPCLAKYDTIYFGNFGMQYSLLGVMAGGSANQIFQNQYGEGSVHIWQTTNCITQTGPAILTPNATFTLSLDLDCVADSLASRICCPSDTLVEIPNGIGYELLSYGCYPDCELSRDTIFFPISPVSTITSTAPDANGIATFTVTNTKPDGSNVPCGEEARLEIWLEIGGTHVHYETLEGLTGGTAASATSTLYGGYTESVLNHIPATDVLFDCSGGTVFAFDTEIFVRLLSEQLQFQSNANIRISTYAGGGGANCPIESTNSDNFTEICQSVLFEVQSIIGLTQSGIATSPSTGGGTGEVIVGDTAWQSIRIDYTNGAVVEVSSPNSCGFIMDSGINALPNGFWVAGGWFGAPDTDTNCNSDSQVEMKFRLNKTYPCLAIKLFDLDGGASSAVSENVINISPAANGWEDISNGNDLMYDYDPALGGIENVFSIPGTTANANIWLYFFNANEVELTYDAPAGRAVYGEIKSCDC